MYSKIVVGTDGSARASKAVLQAGALAKSFGAELHVVSAYRSPATVMAAAAPEAMIAVDDSEWREAIQAEVEATLSQLADTLRADGISVTSHARGGDPAKVIVDVAGSVGADLVVVGNKGMKGKRRLLGSVPNSVAHQAPCSVLIVETV